MKRRRARKKGKRAEVKGGRRGRDGMERAIAASVDEETQGDEIALCRRRGCEEEARVSRVGEGGYEGKTAKTRRRRQEQRATLSPKAQPNIGKGLRRICLRL